MMMQEQAFPEYIRAMRRLGDAALDVEKNNPPRCDSAKAFRDGVPLTEAMEIARNKYAAKTGQPLMDLSEDGVFDSAKAGNKRAMELLLSRLRTRVLFAATGRPVFLSIDDAEDVTQETLLRVAQNLNKIPEARSLIPYALRIVGRLGIDLKRKQAREAEVIVYNSDLVDSILAGGPDHE